MQTLVTALYAEGPTDHRFLPLIIQRTAAHILSKYAHDIVDVLEPMLIEPQEKRSRAENILAIAQRAHGYHLVFIHADADASTAEDALNERINPGVTLVQRAHQRGEQVCLDLVPLIPVQMMEAWMLADREALWNAIGISSASSLSGLPQRVAQVELIADPKQELTHIFAEAIASRTRRVRRRYTIAELYEPLARTVSLSALEQLSAYQRFVADLTQALRNLGFLR